MIVWYQLQQPRDIDSCAACGCVSAQRTVNAACCLGELMDHVGGYINPLTLVARIPPGQAIPRLRDRLVGIIADFRTQTSLREGCNAILAHDCLTLAQVNHPYSCLQGCMFAVAFSSRCLCLANGNSGS